MDISYYLKYPAIITKEDTHYIVQIRGWDGTFSQGKTYDEALKIAYSLIIDMASSYVQDNMEIPHNLKAQEDDVLINIPYDIALKFMLRNIIREQRYRLVDVARKIGVSSQKLNQDLNFDRRTKLDTLANIFNAIDRPLNISC